MSKLIVLQGPPCSGKSTWAKEYVKNNKDTELHPFVVSETGINKKQFTQAIG